MNILDLLIKGKKDVLATPEKELEVSRLSKLLGERVTLKIRALTADEFDTVSKTENMRIAVILKAVTQPNLKDENLRRAYTPQGRKNPLTPKELAQVLFLPGEITNISSEILALSGFCDDAVKEIKTEKDLENAITNEVIKN